MDSSSFQALSSAPLGTAGLSSVSSLQYQGKNPDGQRRHLAKICAEVEGVFINQLMKQMRQTFVNSADPKKKRTEYYQLCEQQVAQALAAGGGIGVARRLFEDLQRHHPASNKENQDETARNPITSGDPAATGDLPVSGTPGMSGSGSPGLDDDPGGYHPGAGRL